MRIIFDGIVYSSTPNGGVFNYFNELIPRVAKMPDTEVRVWVPKVSAPPPSAANVTVERNVLPTVSHSLIPHGRVRRSLGRAKRWLESQLLERRMRGTRDAVFHTTAFTISPWKDIPSVLTIYDMISEILESDLSLPHIAKMRADKKRAIEHADRFIAISAVTKQDLCRVYGIPSDKVDVIHFGVDHDHFGRARSQSERARTKKLFNLDAPYLLYVGGRLHHKNFPRFLEAFAQSACRKDYLLAVAGFDWTPEEKALIARLGVKDRIRHMKYDAVTSTLPALYQMASAFVFPSLYEGFGLPLIEAFAAGCPVAAANAGPFPEIADGAACLFEPSDPSDIARAFESLLVPATAKSYREKGLIRAQHFQWDRAAELTVGVYQAALEGRRIKQKPARVA